MPHPPAGCGHRRQDANNLVISETMADLWYNAPPPRRWPASIPMPRCSPLVRPGKASGGDYVSAGSAPARGPSPRLFRPAIRWIWVRRCWTTGLQLAGKCRHTAAAAAGYAQGAPGHVRNADGGIFSPLAVFATEGGLSFWVELPDMLATLFSARAESQGSISAPVRGLGWKGVRSLFTSAVYAAG